MKKVSKKQALVLHKLTIEEFGGLHGVRDERLLDSALNAPFQTFEEQPLYSTIIAQAAKLCHGFIKNHAFHDGNKRVGVLVLVAFLKSNNIIVKATDEEWINLGLGVASGTMGQKKIIEWVIAHVS